MKAVAYLRVSGASQSDGDGFERQLDAISACAGLCSADYKAEMTTRKERGKRLKRPIDSSACSTPHQDALLFTPRTQNSPILTGRGD